MHVSLIWNIVDMILDNDILSRFPMLSFSFRILAFLCKRAQWLLDDICVTLKCLSINFPFVSNGKFMAYTCLNIQAYCNEAVLCLNFGTPENNEFSIWNKWKIYNF